MTVSLLFFAAYREAVGQKGLTLEVAENVSVRQVADQLEAAYPGLSLKGALAAVNEHYASPDTTLHDGDTLAFLPPVSGGMEEDHFFVTETELDLNAYLGLVSAPAYGAVASFLGTVRSPNAGVLISHIDYEGYESMIKTQMKVLAFETRARFSLGHLVIAHRLGRLSPGEASIAIAVSSAHRRDALESCHYLIDRGKELLPIWKYEVKEDRTGAWVEGKAIAGETL